MLVYRPALKRAFISTLHLAYAAAFLRLQDNNRSAYESASLVSCANALKHAGYLEMLLRGKGPPMLIFKGFEGAQHSGQSAGQRGERSSVIC